MDAGVKTPQCPHLSRTACLNYAGTIITIIEKIDFTPSLLLILANIYFETLSS